MLWWVITASAQEPDPEWPLTTRWARPDGYFDDAARSAGQAVIDSLNF